MPRPRSTSGHSASATETPADRLQASVDELAQNVQVLTDVVDQLREDLSWLTRNGVPHQPLAVVVHRMPLVPVGEGSDGSFDISFAPWPAHDPTAITLSDDQLRAAVVDDVIQRLAEPLGQLAQEHLNALLSVLDHSHREVLQAIRAPRTADAAETRASPQRRRRAKHTLAPAAIETPPAEPPPPPGRLF